MLLGNDPAGDARAEEQRHEIVDLLRRHPALNLERGQGEFGDDDEVILEGLFDSLTQLVVVLDRLDFGEVVKLVEGLEVEVVDVGEMPVREDVVGEALEVPDPVGESVGLVSVVFSYEVNNIPWYKALTWSRVRSGRSWPSRRSASSSDSGHKTPAGGG